MIALSGKIMSVSVDVIGIVICLLLVYSFGSRIKRTEDLGDRLFDWLVWLTIGILITDAITWMVMGIPKYRVVNSIATAMHYFFHPVIGLVWLLYCEYLLYEDEKSVKTVFKFVLAPGLLMAILPFFSFKYALFYSIDSKGVYHRGDYYYLFMTINMIILLYSIFLIAKRAKRDHTDSRATVKNFSLLLYPVFPFVGSVIQSLFYGVNLIWISSTISLLIIYFNIQNYQLILDPLTQINNRYRFESFVDKYFQAVPSKGVKFLALIDLDRFKRINDKYGHLEGDIVLKTMAEILSKSKDKKDFIARIGGDEFVIIGERNTESEINHLSAVINSVLEEHNKNSNKGYNIAYSIGYSTQKDGAKDANQIMQEADRNMYKHKQLMERRNSD